MEVGLWSLALGRVEQLGLRPLHVAVAGDGVALPVLDRTHTSTLLGCASTQVHRHARSLIAHTHTRAVIDRTHTHTRGH